MIQRNIWLYIFFNKIKQEFSAVKVVLKQKGRSTLLNSNRKRTETFETDISSRSDSLNDNDDNLIFHLMQNNVLEKNQGSDKNLKTLLQYDI